MKNEAKVNYNPKKERQNEHELLKTSDDIWGPKFFWIKRFQFWTIFWALVGIWVAQLNERTLEIKEIRNNKKRKKERSSVTRFGEISPFWQHVKSLWPMFEGLFCLGQNFVITLAIFFCFLANYHCCKWLKIEQII